jgi:hypothetical protein
LIQVPINLKKAAYACDASTLITIATERLFAGSDKNDLASRRGMRRRL